MAKTKEASVLKQHIRERAFEEKKRDEHSATYKYHAEKLSREQDQIRKQFERLEREKEQFKGQSYLTRDRRLSVPEGKIFDEAKRNKMTSKSHHLPVDTKNVKSRLFDYEKKESRSRRQLSNQEPGQGNISASPTVPKATQTMEAEKASHTEIIRNLTGIAHGLDSQETSRQKPSTSQYMEKKLSPESEQKSVTSLEAERKAVAETMLFKDSLSIRDTSLPLSRVSQEPTTSRTDSPYVRLRRASLPVPRLSDNRRSSYAEAYDLSPRGRRTSLPARLLTKIKDEEASTEDKEDDDKKLRALYNKAIETVKRTNENLSSGYSTPTYKQRRRSEGGVIDMSKLSATGFDLATLRELENILSDARVYTGRRRSSIGDHSRLDVGSSRAQKKRIEHLEEVLKRINPNYHTPINIDPEEVLKCSYLRLTPSNVETMEQMIREKGKEPGLHAHTDVSNYDIWKGLKEERTDLNPPEKPDKPKSKPRKSLTVTD